MIFFVTLGLLCIMACFLLLGSYIGVLIKGKCVIGTICGIDNGTSYGQGGTAHFIEVQINKDGQDIKLAALNHFFLSPFFEEFKLSRLRKKHIGRRVHIYYDPCGIRNMDREPTTPDASAKSIPLTSRIARGNKTQVLIREYVWKEFLLCVFLLSLGILLIIAGICRWY